LRYGAARLLQRGTTRTLGFTHATATAFLPAAKFRAAGIAARDLDRRLRRGAPSSRLLRRGTTRTLGDLQAVRYAALALIVIGYCTDASAKSKGSASARLPSVGPICRRLRRRDGASSRARDGAQFFSALSKLVSAQSGTGAILSA
jgi:hypothetical protein